MGSCLLVALGHAAAQLPPPLAHVQNLEPVEGKTLVLRQVACEAQGKPATEGRMYLLRNDSGRYTVARIEYNEQGRYILEHGKTAATVSKYYDRYMTEQQPFSMTTMNSLLGLWRFFGMRFSLDNVTYSCRVS